MTTVKAAFGGRVPLVNFDEDTPGQSHLKIEEMIESISKTGDTEMEENEVRDLETIFAQVQDPRMERTKRHRLRDIIIVAICGVICGAEGWVEIEECGKAKEGWFTELLKLPNGIPSHDTFGRVFSLMDPKHFEASFFQWVQGITSTVKGVIAIDGKTLRRSHDGRAGKKALHLVSAWAVENRLVLAQLATEEKSNEITAIPLLLEQLALGGCIVILPRFSGA